jgi:hypothetical protein
LALVCGMVSIHSPGSDMRQVEVTPPRRHTTQGFEVRAWTTCALASVSAGVF